MGRTRFLCSAAVTTHTKRPALPRSRSRVNRTLLVRSCRMGTAAVPLNPRRRSLIPHPVKGDASGGAGAAPQRRLPSADGSGPQRPSQRPAALQLLSRKEVATAPPPAATRHAVATIPDSPRQSSSHFRRNFDKNRHATESPASQPSVALHAGRKVPGNLSRKDPCSRDERRCRKGPASCLPLFGEFLFPLDRANLPVAPVPAGNCRPMRGSPAPPGTGFHSKGGPGARCRNSFSRALFCADDGPALPGSRSRRPSLRAGRTALCPHRGILLQRDSDFFLQPSVAEICNEGPAPLPQGRPAFAWRAPLPDGVFRVRRREKLRPWQDHPPARPCCPFVNAPAGPGAPGPHPQAGRSRSGSRAHRRSAATRKARPFSPGC